MYAVIETGGKQYRVEVGTELEVEHLDVEPGDAITLDRVLLVADGADASIGRPIVADAVVAAEVLRQDRGEKLIAFKYRPKARRRVKKGHRQELTVLRITDLRLGDRSAAEEARQAEEQRRTERERLEEAAARQAAADAQLAAKLAKERPAPEAGQTGGRFRGRRRTTPAQAPEASSGPASGATDVTPEMDAAAARPAEATDDAAPTADESSDASATPTAVAAPENAGSTADVGSEVDSPATDQPGDEQKES